MRIKRLKLTGFKSFVDPSELRIEPGLTGIVGPNGCGKSNLLEAIRWVMGEGSAKSLRGGAMDDVIFAGTERRPSRDFAEVSILAERDASNDDRELEVVRRIERGAGSAYRINGRDVRAKDVALLFADAATGAAIWSEHYDGDRADAQRVLGAHLVLGAGEQGAQQRGRRRAGCSSSTSAAG